ncbi:RHS repeat domain-containing protein [Pseudomonas gingeri]
MKTLIHRLANKPSYRVAALTTLSFLCASQAFAEPYYWFNNNRTAKYPSALAACAGSMIVWSDLTPVRNPRVIPYTDVAYHCIWQQYYPFDGNWYDQDANLYYVYRYGDSCGPDATADCDTQPQKGSPPVLSCVGNPINIAIGNKYEAEDDYVSPDQSSRGFSRYYNSVDGLWRHTYSTYLRFSPDKWALIAADGRELYFNPGTGYSQSGLNTLIQVGETWSWLSEIGEKYEFAANGLLIGWTNTAGAKQTITRANNQTTVTDTSGRQLTFTEDAQHQPLSLSVGGLNIAYTYDSNQHLTHVNRTAAGVTTIRQYLYEDTRNNGLLTGIIDERGVRYATWSYDAQWRAVSSEHAGGAQRTLVTYNADDSRTVTNELGKSTTYRFVTVGNVKRVSAIEGEPSPNCPASNSTYTYNTLGQMLTKTDAKGLVTTYTYNDRGLETSRTEASGTPLSRTTTTEWDPSRVLKTKVVEPTRTTVYTYDAQGRPLSQQTTAN